MSNCYLILPKDKTEREQWGLIQKNSSHPVAIILSDENRSQLLFNKKDLSNCILPASWVLVYSDHETFPLDTRLKLKQALHSLVKDANPRIFHHGGEVNSGNQCEVEKKFEEAGFIEAGFSRSSVRYFTEDGDFDWKTDIENARKNIKNGNAFKDIVDHLDKAWNKASDRFCQAESSAGPVDENWLNGIKDNIDRVLNGQHDGMTDGVVSRLMSLFVDLSGHLADPEKLTGEDFKRAFEAYVASEKELSGWIGDLSRIRAAIERIDDAQQKKKLSDVVESGLLLLLSYKLFSDKYTEYHDLPKK